MCACFIASTKKNTLRWKLDGKIIAKNYYYETSEQKWENENKEKKRKESSEELELN